MPKSVKGVEEEQLRKVNRGQTPGYIAVGLGEQIRKGNDRKTVQVDSLI